MVLGSAQIPVVIDVRNGAEKALLLGALHRYIGADEGVSQIVAQHPRLLKAVDRRAKALGVSRNRLVVRALEQAVSERSGWAPEFLKRLRNVDGNTSAAVDALLVAVTEARRSKRPRDF